MSTTMSRAEREAFLADLHVGLLALSREGRGPLNVPVWYDYTPGGDIWFITDRDSRKGKLMQVGTRVGFCVQTEVAPYQYVSIEGPVVSIAPALVDAHLKPMAQRYLGLAQGEQYAANSHDGESALIYVRPEQWLSVDYRKR